MIKPKIYYKKGVWWVKGPVPGGVVWYDSDSWQEAWRQYEENRLSKI